MAPVTEPDVVLVFPWQHFQAVKNGAPLIGGKLWSYVPSTSTPKATFFDPFYTVAHENPVILDDQGAATIWLDGSYDLRLYDAEDVLLWQIDSYSWSSGLTPSPGAVQVGTSQVTLTALDGASVLTASNLVPAGYRVLGVRTAITANFGTSRGLQRLLIGDSTSNTRWGVQPTLTAVTGTTQQDFRSGDAPIASGAGYTVLIAADGGRYDANGAILLTCHWERLLETAGAPSTGLETGSAQVTVQAQDGARVLTVGGLAPVGSRILGVTTAITTAFGTSRGLQALLVGDATDNTRWGRTTTLSAAAVTTQGNFRAGDAPIASTPYSVYIAADGGRYDGVGEIQVSVIWSTLTA